MVRQTMHATLKGQLRCLHRAGVPSLEHHPDLNCCDFIQFGLKAKSLIYLYLAISLGSLAINVCPRIFIFAE
jgi:hypothetical protein